VLGEPGVLILLLPADQQRCQRRSRIIRVHSLRHLPGWGGGGAQREINGMN
jgi:hypothetical protein